MGHDPTRAPPHCSCALLYPCTKSAVCREYPRRADRNATLARRCLAPAPLLCSCARSAMCRECPRRPDRNATPARQMQVRAPIPTFICGFAQPFRLRYAGSRSRAPLTHASPLELRSLLQVSRQPPLPIPGFPAEMAVIGQEYDGKPGIHTGSAKALAPKRAARPARTDRGSTHGPTHRRPTPGKHRGGRSTHPSGHLITSKASRLTKNAPSHPQRRRTTTSGSPSPVVVRTLSMPRV